MEEKLMEKIINQVIEKTPIKRKSNICKLCNQKIRKNYPFGKNSKVRIIGHKKTCDMGK